MDGTKLRSGTISWASLTLYGAVNMLDTCEGSKRAIMREASPQRPVPNAIFRDLARASGAYPGPHVSMNALLDELQVPWHKVRVQFKATGAALAR